MKKPPEIDERYAAPDAADVRLSVRVGDGQIGLIRVFIGPTLKVSAPNVIGRLLVGTGASLRGQTVRVRTTVNDVLAQTNKMSVSYGLEGGAQPLDVSHDGEVDADGDMLLFKAAFRMA